MVQESAHQQMQDIESKAKMVKVDEPHQHAVLCPCAVKMGVGRRIL